MLALFHLVVIGIDYQLDEPLFMFGQRRDSVHLSLANDAKSQGYDKHILKPSFQKNGFFNGGYKTSIEEKQLR